ncbi:chromosome partition protein smc [Legionella busanensis]|uniref:Chromosome partition protein Smc n=1 Tax=Legionella busanensis TaxID=190655 RepID=A0A378JMT9_9GAMM|nr:chromosome segregation protein SMC [Legionella busanensis]STX52686.1 chromosome partition protein smc [Legionella busanensis]
MHLKQLKLAGFKSFVDPISIPFPSHLVAVVGPNGCGKSNIIDAVRWVLGESSAKTLRGESLTDIIFNGSTNRKAVGQASVELIFDNSLGRLGGQYGNYQEIAIKRLVTRAGDSLYFLNGIRCRRRDITDLFLGTGAGARGYSIIGQGTVSRLVEAQPEELRAHLEEAAGISKYKERRRETVMRINQTRENLARVSDIRDELTKQLQRLERQAKAAAYYQELKNLERTYKAEIIALKWQDLTKQSSQLENQINQFTIDYEQYQTSITQIYSHNTSLKIRIEQTQDVIETQQAHFYQLTTEIARLEEQLQQQNQEHQRLLMNRQTIYTEQLELNTQLNHEQKLIQNYQDDIKRTEFNLEASKQQLIKKQQLYQVAKQEQLEWQTKIKEVQTNLTRTEQELQVQQVHYQHIIQEQQNVQITFDKNTDLLSSLTQELNAINLVQEKTNLIHLENKKTEQEINYQRLFNNLGEIRQQLIQTEAELYQAQDQMHQLTAKHASVAAILATIKKQSYSSIKDHPRLFESLIVDKEWQYACELVLKDYLQATVVTSLQPILAKLNELADNSQSFTTPYFNLKKSTNYPCLADKISSSVPYFLPNLHKVFTASSVIEACSWLPQIGEDESIITKEGCWLAKGWIRITGKAPVDTVSLLAKQEELSHLESELQQAQTNLEQLKQKRDELHLFLEEQQEKVVASKEELNIILDEIRSEKTRIDTLQLKIEQLNTKRQELLKDNEQIKQRLVDLADQRFTIDQIIAAALPLKQQFLAEQEQYNRSKQDFDDAFLFKEKDLHEARNLMHQLEIENERNQLTYKQITANAAAKQDKLILLKERLKEDDKQLATLLESNFSCEKKLEVRLEEHKKVEQSLQVIREELNDDKAKFTAQEAKIKADEKQIKILQEKMQQLQLQLQTFRVQIGNLLDVLKEQGFQVQALIKALAPEITIKVREQHIEEIVTEINRLGAINLAAIEEYSNEMQRKQYLDEQYSDLINALAMLEVAIEKLDKETKLRFQQTFNDVNATFQSLFPRLFGGGRAALELTGDNLLEAGVLITAQPPGKRNNTIYLLSGGEKAMIAVALIFAIFQLNPSPFCMLDEVDAPLDDVNIGRFCNLVKEMSQVVQFLFITHNKITMELADHLIGVTMREPGVSRIVSVDVEQALAITEA